MSLTGYSTFPKALLLDPHHQMFWCHILDIRRVEGLTRVEVLLNSRDAVGVFYRLRLADDGLILVNIYIYIVYEFYLCIFYLGWYLNRWLV